MNAHTAAPTHQHIHVPAAGWVPVVLGLLYGAWVGWLAHNKGQEMFRAEMHGLAAAGVLMALCAGVAAFQHKVMNEIRAAMWGAVFGMVMGYGYRLSGSSILKGSMMGLLFAFLMGGIVFYFLHNATPARPPAGELATQAPGRDAALMGRARGRIEGGGTDRRSIEERSQDKRLMGERTQPPGPGPGSAGPGPAGPVA